MRGADDECCGAHPASSERADRTVPAPMHCAPSADSNETVEQTAVRGHEQTQQ
jgi:hypothetical protein